MRLMSAACLGSRHPPLKDGCSGLTTHLYALILFDTWSDRAVVLPVLAQGRLRTPHGKLPLRSWCEGSCHCPRMTRGQPSV